MIPSPSGRTWEQWATAVIQVLTPRLQNLQDSKFSQGQIPKVSAFTVATLPSAAVHFNGVIVVSDETGGRTLATSDGTNWKRVSDGATVS
jgi:hypothetical protein